MNMKKTVRKMSAILAGATMVGATVVGAMAYDLSDYPSPFIEDGFFTGKIVVGEKALPADIIGATDIASALQAESVTPVSTTGTGASTSIEGGYLFSESKDLVLGSDLQDINPLVDDTELPEMLGHGVVKNDDNQEVEYDLEIALEAGTSVLDALVDTGYDLDDVTSEPVLYYDFDGDVFYTATILFDDEWDAEEFTESQSIELFGQVYTFDPNNDNADEVLTLFGTDSEVYVEKGEKATVKYEGTDYTIEVLGGNTDADPATVIMRVGSITKTVEEGESEDFDGTLPIYVKDVFIDNTIAAGADIAVQLFVGSNEIELDTDGTVTVNGVELDEVTVAVTSTPALSWTAVEEIEFTVTPSNAEDEVEYIMNGESYVDPVFGSFKFHLAEAANFADDKEELTFTSTDDGVTMTFTPLGGDSYDFDVADLDLVNDLAEDFVGGTALANVSKDVIFIYNDGATPADDDIVTHVLQITNIEDAATFNADFEVEVEDLTFGKTYTLTKCESISSDIELYPEVTGVADEITLTTDSDCSGNDYTGAMVVYTEAGAEVTMVVNTTDAQFSVVEDYQDDIDTLSAVDTIVVNFDIDTDEYDLATVTGADSELGDDDDLDYFLTPFGTYVIAESETDSRVATLYIPDEEVHYDMFLAPVESTVVVTEGSDSGAYTINPLPVGSTVLDKDAMNLIGNTPLIVVGGPFVNTVAAELMGNPTSEQINTMFTAGFGKIKLYTTQNALLVAGYNAQDTLGAAYVLAEHSKYDLTGTEVEVVVPSLSSISVRTPQ
ncbi:MAG: hypothetical protein ACP5N2_04600 [Candidatus Nanoarchaeia archaeon]